MKRASHFAIAAWALLLAACGGGDGAAPAAAAAPMNSELPNVATQDPAAAVGYAAALAGNTSETSEPVQTGADTLATSDTAEPAP